MWSLIPDDKKYLKKEGENMRKEGKGEGLGESSNEINARRRMTFNILTDDVQE